MAKKEITVTFKKPKLRVKPALPNSSINAPLNRGLFTQMRYVYDVDGLYDKYGSKMVSDARNLTAQEFVDLFDI